METQIKTKKENWVSQEWYQNGNEDKKRKRKRERESWRETERYGGSVRESE